MNTKIKINFLLLLLFSFNGLFALDIDKEAQAYVKGEYNRGSYSNGEIQLIGNIGLNQLLDFGTGFSYLQNTESAEINIFFKAGVSPFSNQYASPLNFSVSYIFNGIVEYDINTHSILPLISYKTDRFGASIGPSFRFTSFFGETPQFESILSFYVYGNFIKTDSLLIGAGCGTFDEFNARNMAALWLDLHADIRLNDYFTFMNQIVWMQSGLDGLTTTFYGISYRGGIKFSW